MAETIMKFRLRAGTHVERSKPGAADRKLYKKGDIVPSTKNLQRIFGRGKFVQVPDVVIASPGEELDQQDVVAVEDKRELTLEQELELEREEEQSKARSEANRKKADAAAKVEEDEEELGGDGSDLKEIKGDASIGDDVSSQFETALAEEFVVYKKGKLHYVADGDAPDKLLNKKGLKEAEVEKFIKDYVSEG